MKIIANSVIFQSTPPRGWRPDGCFKYPPGTAYFNPLHHEGGDHVQTSYGNEISYFNPLHHEGGDKIFDFDYPIFDISIHSTTRVETQACFKKYVFHQQISIHSTTRVETSDDALHTHQDSDFNPLHHEGGDKASMGIPSTRWNFNPLHHEGGDGRSLAFPPGPCYFNPLHHEGGDTAAGVGITNGMIFQSTPPRGWRLLSNF